MSLNEAFSEILSFFELPEPEMHAEAMVRDLQEIQTQMETVSDENLRASLIAYIEEWSADGAITSDPEVFQQQTSEMALDLGNAGFLSE
ncbi:hypothetical protein HY479_01490 [Candidatus Uhrbacteria bacterium]|nr:hypothetical protein [Candidatus Uhrbacteria bacterium]